MIFKKWKDNVSEGPVKDEDDFFLNYITHPYWGAVYYMSARSAGANIFYSFLYSNTCNFNKGKRTLERHAERFENRYQLFLRLSGFCPGQF